MLIFLSDQKGSSLAFPCIGSRARPRVWEMSQVRVKWQGASFAWMDRSEQHGNSYNVHHNTKAHKTGF